MAPERLEERSRLSENNILPHLQKVLGERVGKLGKEHSYKLPC